MKAKLICILILWLCTFVAPANAYETTVRLEDINSATTDPPGSFRWLDVANQPYSQNIIDAYDYNQADVTVTYTIEGGILQGTLAALNLKPNFAYQLKLNGIPGTASNVNIGLAGRWWQDLTPYSYPEWSNEDLTPTRGVFSLDPPFNGRPQLLCSNREIEGTFPYSLILQK